MGAVGFWVHPTIARLAKPLVVLDAAGLGLFAVAGARKALDHGIGTVGAIGIGMLTAIGGGIIRDALIGATPVAALGDWRYLVTPAVVGAVGFWVHPTIARLAKPLVVLDAAGLGLFAVAGARKALDHGIGTVGAIGIGMLTAIGGGIIRDVLVREIPTVLLREIYATAALVGAAIVEIGRAHV